MPSPPVILTEEQLGDVVIAYTGFDEFVFDVETVGTCSRGALCPLTNEVTWLGLAGPGRTDVIPVAHPTGPQQLWPATVFEALRPLFFSERRKIGHNLKFDVRTVAKYFGGELPPPPYGDTLILVNILNENLVKKSLDYLTQRYFEFAYEQLGKKGPEKFPFDKAALYSFYDCQYSWLVWKYLYPGLDRPMEKLHHVFDLEMELLGPVMRMENNGAPIDFETLAQFETNLQDRMRKIESDLYRSLGREVVLTNRAEIARILFGSKEDGNLQKAPLRYTPKRNEPAVTKDVLKHYAKSNKTVAMIEQWQRMQKLTSTYTGPLREKSYEGRIFTNFNQLGARTGRFSSSGSKSAGMNLQNIPKRQQDDDFKVRRVFVAPEGHSLVVADFSQVELRVLAHYSGDPTLKKAFTEKGTDLHGQTAAVVFNKSFEEVTEVERHLGKTLNFGIAYGAAPMRVRAEAASVGLKIGIKKAKELCDRLNVLYSRIEQWKTHVVTEAKGHRSWPSGHPDPHVRTIIGRKRRLPDLKSPNMKLRMKAERQAVNAVIQGSALDILKICMVKLDRHLHEPENAEVRMILTVHDELVFTAPDAEADRVVRLVRSVMEGIKLLSVPLEVDVKVSKRWSES